MQRDFRIHRRCNLESRCKKPFAGEVRDGFEIKSGGFEDRLMQCSVRIHRRSDLICQCKKSLVNTRGLQVGTSTFLGPLTRRWETVFALGVELCPTHDPSTRNAYLRGQRATLRDFDL